MPRYRFRVILKKLVFGFIYITVWIRKYRINKIIKPPSIVPIIANASFPFSLDLLMPIIPKITAKTDAIHPLIKNKYKRISDITKGA